MSYLSDILKRKSREVEGLRDVRRGEAPPPKATDARAFYRALLLSEGTAVIAEIKRSSPSVGAIRPDLDIEERAVRYATAGASAISVLTDGPGFGGSFDDLRRVRANVSLPLLCKDFFLDEVQVEEARRAGANAILLIVAALTDRRLRALLECAQGLGMDALVETHDESEVARALAIGADMVGVNNRDLGTFTIDLTTTARLIPLLPEGVLGVSESGVRTIEDARRLIQSGPRALLIGEALVRSDDPEGFIRAIRGPRE